MHTKSARRVTLSAFLATLMIIASVTAVFAQAGYPVPGEIYQNSWDAAAQGWTTGTNDSYGDGQTAIMVAGFKESVTLHQPWLMQICLQVWEKSSNPIVYRFSSFTSIDTFVPHGIQVRPTVLPKGNTNDPTVNFPAWADLAAPTAPWTRNGLIHAYNATINSISGPVQGTGGTHCNDNELDLELTFTPNVWPFYVLWGGRVAMAGDPLPAFAPDYPTVPAGRGASALPNSTFQSRFNIGAADKTLNFKPLGPNAVVLSRATASSGMPVFGFVLVGLLVVAGGSVLGWKRLQRR